MRPLNPLMREAENALFRGLLLLPEMYLRERDIKKEIIFIQTDTPYVKGLSMTMGDGINVAGALREIMEGYKGGNLDAFIFAYDMYWEMMK